MKKAKYIVWVLILSVLFSMPVCAAETFELGISEIKVSENIMEVQVSNNLEDVSQPVTYEMSLEGELLPLLSVDSIKNTGYNTSYAFLVDVSGSMKRSVIEDIKLILENLVNEMETGDNACLMLIGDKIYSGEFSDNKATLLQEIAAIEMLTEDTNLYFGINQALDILDTNNKVLDRKCLVILSDGEDDQITGITKEEVEKKIEEKNITISSIAMIGDNPSEKKQETAKIIGSFARMSPGGNHTLFIGEEANAENVAKQIVKNNSESVVIKADVSEFNTETNTAYIEVVATVDAVGTAKANCDVPTAYIKKGMIEEVPEVVEEPKAEEADIEETETKVEIEEKEEEKINLVWVVVPVSVLVAVIIILIAVNKRKKKLFCEEQQRIRELEEAQRAMEQNGANEEVYEEQEIATAEPISEEETTAEEISEENKTVPLNITLIKIGLEEKQERHLSIIDTFVVGRREEKCDLAFTEDTLISQRHFQFVNDAGKLAIEDLGSLNGTLVNGVLIKQRFYLTNEDIIVFGNNKWRILIKED